MQQIFVDQSVKIDDTFMVEGEDARHLLQVLRMRQGEQLRVSTHEGRQLSVSDRVGGQRTGHASGLGRSGIHRIRKTYLSFSGSAKG